MGKRWIVVLLVAVGLLLILLFVLRELGTVSFDLYTSEAATERTGTFMGSFPTGDDPSLSYDLTLSYDGEPLSYSSVHVMDKPVLDINVDVIPTVLGSPGMPLYKSFSVEFSAPWESSTPDGMYSLSGNVTGSTQMKIIGLCTRRKALELAQDEIMNNVDTYLTEQLASQSE
jgi:hypothetical protein